MNKRGGEVWTAKEVAGVVLGVIGVIILIYLSVQVYGIFKAKNAIEQAKVNLENIDSKLKLLKEGQSTNYFVYSPAGYMIIGFPWKDKIPEICKKNNWKGCLCFCERRSSSVGTLISKEGWQLNPDYYSEKCTLCRGYDISVGTFNYAPEINTFVQERNVDLDIDKLLENKQSLKLTYFDKGTSEGGEAIRGYGIMAWSEK